MLLPRLARHRRYAAAGLGAAALGGAAAWATPAATASAAALPPLPPPARCPRLAVPSTAALSAASSPRHWAQRHPAALALATLPSGRYRATIADEDVTRCVQRSAATGLERAYDTVSTPSRQPRTPQRSAATHSAAAVPQPLRANGSVSQHALVYWPGETTTPRTDAPRYGVVFIPGTGAGGQFLTQTTILEWKMTVLLLKQDAFVRQSDRPTATARRRTR